MPDTLICVNSGVVQSFSGLVDRSGRHAQNRAVMTQSACPFCTLPPERIRFGSARAFVIDDGFPVSLGHALIIPRRHVASLFELDIDEQREMIELLAHARSRLLEERQPNAFNIGINDGVAAGQTVMHLHIHLIPRYLGDRLDPRGGVRWIFPDKADYWSPHP